MTTLHILSHVDTIITTAMRLYALGGELFSITAILLCLNFLGNCIKNTYAAGYAVGKFYRRYLHKPLKWLLIHAIALIILLAQLTWEGAVVIYKNREEISAAIICGWQTVEKAFIYESPLYYWPTDLSMSLNCSSHCITFMHPKSQSMALSAGIVGIAALAGASPFIIATGCGLMIYEAFRKPEEYMADLNKANDKDRR